MIIHSSGICCSGLAYKSYISFGSFMKANTHLGLLHLKNHTKIFAYWKTDSNQKTDSIFTIKVSGFLKCPLRI